MISKTFATKLVANTMAEVSTEAFGLACQMIVTIICGLVYPLILAVVVSASC